MTATNLIKAKMQEHKLTNAQVADMLGISSQSFSYKLNNRVEFKASEIIKLCDILKIEDKESYFFAN